MAMYRTARKFKEGSMKKIKGIMPINRTILSWGILFITIAVFGLLSTQATAASFDCKKAATWVEKTVCANPELSKLDEEMAKAYHDALASLSPEGQKETRQYQKQWLKEISYIKGGRSLFSKRASPIKGWGSSSKHDISPLLLKDAYEIRITQLKQILIRFPDRIFRKVYVSYSKTEKTCPNFFVKQELIYPQIENPHKENERLWNKLIFQKVSDDLKNLGENDCTDIDVKYTVSFNNKHLISIQGWQFWYAHGAPHGYTNMRSSSWLLEANRVLQAADLFDQKTGWRNKLVALVSQGLKDQEVAEKVIYKMEPSMLMNIATSPDCWVISKDGLGIQFGEYELGSQAAPLIIIDWKTLDPYISESGHSLISD
jgi:hypothetical protein